MHSARKDEKFFGANLKTEDIEGAQVGYKTSRIKNMYAIVKQKMRKTNGGVSPSASSVKESVTGKLYNDPKP